MRMTAAGMIWRQGKRKRIVFALSIERSDFIQAHAEDLFFDALKYLDPSGGRSKMINLVFAGVIL